jgi:hypothetical protein
MAEMNPQQRIEELKREIEEIKKSLPKHSIPASMLIRLEELEEELARLGSINQPFHTP